MNSSLHAAWRKTLKRCGPRRAVVEASSGATATFAELADLAAAWRARHPGENALRGRPFVFGDRNGISWLATFLGLLEAGAVAVPVDPGEPPAAREDVARRLAPRRFRAPIPVLIKLTSGSTGAPRALPFTAAQMLADGRQVCRSMGIGRADLNYGMIPFGHSYGLGNLVIPLLADGIPVVCGTGPLPHAIAADFERWRPTVFPGVPTLWRALAASGIPAESLSSLRLAISAGAPLPAEVADAVAERFGRRICSFYGSSETGGISFDRTGRAPQEGHVGKPLAGVKIRPIGGGRIRICSAAVYTIGNRRRTGNAGCWVPADKASLDARGRVILTGRLGKTAKVGGRRVSLDEIAGTIRKCAGVRDAWVTCTADAEPVIAAAVATDLTIPQLRSALHTATAPWKIPKKWLLLRELPMNARGKVDAPALRAALAG